MILEYQVKKERKPSNIIMGTIAYKSMVLAISEEKGEPTFPRQIEGVPIILVDGLQFAGIVLLGDKPDPSEI
jgi:hypothetical protein